MLGWWNWLSAAVVAGLAVVTAWLRQQDPIILFVIGLCTFAAMVIIFERLAARRHRRRSAAPQKTGKPERNDHWTERKQLEIYVLANASSGVDPIALPVDKDPQLTRLRELKDAITRDELDATLNGDRPNVMSTISLQSFEQYVSATNKLYWVEVLHRWQARQNKEPNQQANTRKERANVISKHDVSLRDAIYYIATRKWGELKALTSGNLEADQATIDSVEKAWKDAQQAACDGDLPIWGIEINQSFSEIYIEIHDPAYWRTNWINWFYLAKGNNNEQAVEHDLDQVLSSDPLYYSLATSKAKVEELWPPENT